MTTQSAATTVLVLVPIAAMLLGGCDQFPAPVADSDPEPAQAAAPPPADVTPAVPQTPERMVDEFLATAPNLRTDDQLRELSALEEGLDRVRDLDLRSSAVSDIGAAALPAFVAATRLDLSGSRVTTGVTQHLIGMTRLEELHLDNLPIEDASIASLSELPALRAVSLSGTPVTDDCFLHLAECEPLESITISNNERLLGHGFSELLRRRKFEMLRELSVNHTGFGYHGFEELNRLSQLEFLSASDAEVTDPALDGIRSCRKLRTLNLSNNRLSDAGMERLSGFRELVDLDVSGCPGITDEGLLYMHHHKQLRRLSLEGTSCSLAGARDLKEKFLENTTILIADQEL